MPDDLIVVAPVYTPPAPAPESYVEDLRAAHLEAIEDNGFDCILDGTRKERQGGGFADVDFDVGSCRARLYQEATGRSGREQNENIAAITEVDARWGLLLPDTIVPPGGGARIPTVPAIEVGPNVTTRFTHPVMGTFEITNIYPRQDLGEVWGWAASAEQVR